MFGAQVGPMELVLVLAVALIVLGPKRLPEAGRSIGRGMRELRDALNGATSRDDDESYDEHDEHHEHDELVPPAAEGDRPAAPHP